MTRFQNVGKIVVVEVCHLSIRFYNEIMVKDELHFNETINHFLHNNNSEQTFRLIT